MTSFTPPSLPPDKANHLMWGAIITSVVSAVCLSGHISLTWSIAWSMVATTLAMAAKEASDAYLNKRATGDWRKGSHGVELLDGVAGVGGGALVALPLVVLDFMVRS